MIPNVVQAAGGIFAVVGAFLLATWLGFLTAGVGLILFGLTLESEG